MASRWWAGVSALVSAALAGRPAAPSPSDPVRQDDAAPAPPEAGLGPWNYRGHADQPFGPVSYAQFGEDVILLNLFYQLGIDRPSFLDIGAHHPVNCSNTALLYARGSRGVCVDANPNLVGAFATLRPEDVTLNIGVGATAGTLDFYMIDDWSGRNSFDRETTEAFVAANPAFRIQQVKQIPVVPLDEIVAKHFPGGWPDLLSLDAEGLDHAILQASRLRAGQGPKVICVEAVSGDDRDQEQSLGVLLTERGYVPAARTIGNVLWRAHRD